MDQFHIIVKIIWEKVLKYLKESDSWIYLNSIK